MTKFFSDLELEKVYSPIGLNMKLMLPDMPLPEGLLDLAAETNIQCMDTEDAFTIYAFSEGSAFSGVLLMLHGHAENGIITHFYITVRRKPDGEPPDEVVEGNNKTGGYPEVLNRIFALFPEQKVQCEAEADFYNQKTSVKIFPTEKVKNGLILENKKLTYRSDTENDVISITVQSKARGSIVNVETKFDIVLSPECIESAASALWDKASSIDKHNE